MEKITMYRCYRGENQMTCMVNGKGYAIENVCFYNRDGVVVKTNSWIGDQRDNEVSFVIQNPIKRIYKINFKNNFPFVIKNENAMYDMYIPYNDYTWHTSYVKKGLNIMKNIHMEDYFIYIYVSVKSLYDNIYDKYSRYIKQLKTLEPIYSTEMPVNFTTGYIKLAQAYQEWSDAIEYAKNYTVEDYFNEQRKDD